MKPSTFLYSLAMLATAIASPTTNAPARHTKTGKVADYIKLGPLPYKPLQVKVARLKEDSAEDFHISEEGPDLGLYLCEHNDFQGDCYWGQ
jgi:hypothetical protein